MDSDTFDKPITFEDGVPILKLTPQPGTLFIKDIKIERTTYLDWIAFDPDNPPIDKYCLVKAYDGIDGELEYLLAKCKKAWQEELLKAGHYWDYDDFGISEFDRQMTVLEYVILPELESE